MKNLVVALLVLAMGSAAFATENKPKKKITKTVDTTIEEVEDTGEPAAPANPNEEKGPTIVKEEFVFENSSAHNRMNKKYIA